MLQFLPIVALIGTGLPTTSVDRKQDGPVTIERIDQIKEDSKIICVSAFEGVDPGKYLEEFMDRKRYSPTETMVFLDFCDVYRRGLRDGQKK